MNTIKEIEDAMADIMLENGYHAIEAEFERLLKIMGNVDGNEIIPFVLVAAKNAK